MDRYDFMRRAVELSRQKMHEHRGGPFAAVVVLDGQIVARGGTRSRAATIRPRTRR